MAPTILFLALLAYPAAGVLLRDAQVATIKADPATPKAIKAKWDKMDQFLEVMFTMACTWKHGKDINGLAAEKLKNGEVDGAEGYAAYVKEMQDKNVKGLERSCGLIVASQKKTCRQGCATRWNANAGERNGCDSKCVTVYANFEKSCISKADDLEKVYNLKESKAEAQQQCYKGHCKEFPQVWMKAKASEMTAEVETQCTSRCTDKNVKAGCQKKWMLEADFVAAKVGSDCQDKSGVTKCFNGKKATVSTAYDKCKTDTAKTCGDAFTKCNKGEQAKGFCTDRKKMCQEQADKKCLDENKAGLDKAKNDCESKAKGELTTCKNDAMTKEQTDREAACIKETGPKCKGDCKGKCEVTKMNECLLMLKGQEDPGKMFCKDFWRLLHTSSEVDPVTGNPIVLLQQEPIV